MVCSGAAQEVREISVAPVGMLSPRLCHPDVVIDSVESLVAQSGLDALTIRVLIRATGFSNGAIYRTFGSRGGLIGRMWLRAESRFLEVLKSLIAQAQNPFDAVLAAAEASFLYPQRYPTSAAVLFTVRRDEALSQPMPTDLSDQLRALDQELVEIMSSLAMNLWNRSDADAVDLVATCILDLPKWMVQRATRLATPVVGEYLREAIGALLAVGPPPIARRHDIGSAAGAFRVVM